MSAEKKATSMSAGRQWRTGGSRFSRRWAHAALLLAAMATPQLRGAEPVPLRFNTFFPDVNVPNVNNELGPGYTGGLTMHFLGVATCGATTIDARATTVVRPNTEFATGDTNRTARGFIPDYKATSAGQPEGDLGFLYAAADGNAPGITLTLSFFDGTGDRSGTFADVYVIPDLRLLVYDVDGEPTQTECFDVFFADGLYTYATGSAAASVMAVPTETGVHFIGPGRDFKETDTSGAVVLQYRDTSRITLAFTSEQGKGRANPVFSAIDGDLSLAVTGGFQAPTIAPAPRPAPTAPRLYSADNAIRLDRVAPAEVPLNVPFDYTLKVTNVAQTALHNVVVVERLPENFALRSTSPEIEKTDGSLYWTVGSLNAQASRELKVSGVATTAENVKPCATVTFEVPPLCADIAVLEPKLTLAAMVSKEVLICDPIEMQFVVTNQGTGVAEGVRIVDVLPAGLQTKDGKTELMLDIGALAPGESRRLTGLVKAGKTGEYVNTAIVSAHGGLTADATTTTMVRQPVLAIAKTGPAREYLGQSVTYEITVTNNGDAPAANARVEDTIPQGTQDVRTSPAGVVSASKVVWELGTLGVNATKKLSITYTPVGVEPLVQTATASAVCADAATATTKTAMYGIAAVLLEVVDTDDPVRVGGRTTYIITATNQGSSPSTNMQITAFVEDTGEIVATGGSTPVTVEGNVARSAPLASLAPKAKATWQITVKALKAGDVRFRATMTTAELGRDVEETEATQFYE